VPVVLRRSRSQQIHGIGDARSGRHDFVQPRNGGLCQRGHHQPFGLACISGENGGASGVAHDPHTHARWEGRVVEERSDVEKLLERSGANDARLLEQRLDDAIVTRQGAGVRGGRPCAGARAPGFHGDHRLLARDAACDAREVTRIPEALEIEQDDARPRVVGPVLDEVVAGHVGFVPDGREGRDAQVELSRVTHQRQSQGAALRQERDITRRGHGRGEARVERHRRICVDEAHAVRPDEPCAELPRPSCEPLGRGLGSRASFGSDAGDDEAEPRRRAGILGFHVCSPLLSSMRPLDAHAEQAARKHHHAAK
jgi:hypothetical protein